MANTVQQLQNQGIGRGDEAKKVNRLRFKLGEKAKQEPKTLPSPEGISMYEHIYKLGLISL